MRTFEQYIDEAYNFRLGGSQKKGFNQPKMFGDLEEGDVFYYAMYDKRVEFNNAAYYIRQYTFYKREKEIYETKTRLFITIKGNTNTFFTIPNRNLDSTLSVGETQDLCRHIISTDKNEFFKELNKATKGEYSEKDLEVIE